MDRIGTIWTCLVLSLATAASAGQAPITGNRPFAAKPFSVADLLTTISELLSPDRD